MSRDAFREPWSREDASQAAKPLILVIDDEPRILQAVIDVLEDNYQVLTASGGPDGLTILGENPDVSVILCDQRMPQMEGAEFFRRARELSLATRVLVTGYADFDAIVRAVNEGQIHSYMSKPFDHQQLLVVVHAARQAYEMAAALQAERALLHGLMDNSPDLISFKDADGCFLRVNDAQARHLGFDRPAQLVGKREEYFIPADEAAELADTERRLYKEGAPLVHQVLRQELPDGSDRWWSTVTAPIRKHAEIIATVSIRRDVSEERQIERKLAEHRHAAVHDPLTGLPNRRRLEERMRELQAQAKRRYTSVALLYIDLDNFKPVNDSFGHDIGDQVLKQAAALIQSCLRETDIVARLGGDEFVVLGEVSPEQPHIDARLVATRILDSIRRGISLPDSRIQIGCSIGGAIFPADRQDFSDVMRLADHAMYEAKRSGKNAIRFSGE